ncbi:hypothetical protein Vretimale_10522 [Volvox reticuliferus]|uniref:SAM domain-containing protein n=1 Tax=Volvox reticuliferus TaxID=1737510 RepID=A0A8J4GFN8_9CHLO|nr:hypothetical protein Vretifemale_12464 [Volvox reticuliferus]GIM06112.1 hypothetical protein Vretimale_10522 [Volvox reticuliferus]
MANENHGNGVEKWTNSDVLNFLGRNDLVALVPVFKENEVTGLDLLLLTEDELRSMLGISKLQAAKVKALVDANAARPDTEDPGVSHDFRTGAIPRISDRVEDYGEDEEEVSDLRRAGTGVHLPAPTATAPVAAAAAADETPVSMPVIPPATGWMLQQPAATATTATVAAEQPPQPPQPRVVGTVIPMAAAPMLPPGTGALQVDAHTVALYQQSVATITRLEGERVAQELPGARSRLAATKKRLKLQEAKFEELRKEEAKRNKKLEELVGGKWYPGKYILGAKRREQKISRNTEKLEAVSQKVRAVASQLEELHAAEQQQSNLVSELAAKCTALDEARSFCSTLLQSAFAGGAVGDARENMLEAEVAALGPKIEEVRRYKSVYGKAYELMRAAREALDQAWQMLESASGLATIDVASNFLSPIPMMNSPGGLMVDIMKRGQMQQGVQLCQVAAELALKSRAMVPDMPRVDAEKLRRLRVGFGMMDVVFDNLISDMMVASKIRGILGGLRSVVSDVEYAERWLHGWISGRINEDLR